jgi:hypothetical protein
MANLVGRPRIILDQERIAELVGKGYTVEWVADYFNVHVDTLYVNYSDSLRKGYAFRNGCLQAKQFENAITGNATLQIWLGKQWLKQRDVEQKQERTDIKVSIQLNEASRSEALAIVAKLMEE